MPARWIPLLYLGSAHLSLLAAFALVARDPAGFAGFFYHPRMLAIVHLVTLGWISGSILGSFYVVGPLALRVTLPAGGADYAAFAGFAVGLLGMVTHFWVDSPGGMAWAAGLVAASMSHVALRGLLGVARAPIPLEVRVPVALAFVNLLGAAVLGVLLGANKVVGVLTVNHLDTVFAHAHLAAVGWGAMMVMGVGYRMLPMILPAAMPRGPWVYASSVLVEAGLGALVVAFLRGGRGVLPSAVLLVAGLGVFLSRVAWMLRHRRPAPSELRRPDWGVAHAMSALAALVVAAALGLWLAASERSEATLAAVSGYGVLGLVGFLSQIVVGVEARVLPLFGWLWGFADRGQAELPPSMHGVAARRVQAAGFACWTLGVPVLAAGLWGAKPMLIGTGAAALFLAVALNLGNGLLVLRRLWRPEARAGG